MKVLLVAENASARFGGEAFLPLHYFRILRSRGIETWLVTHARTRDELLSCFPDEASRMFFVPDMQIQIQLYRLERFLPRRVFESTLGLVCHLLTQWHQRSLVRRLVKQHGIHVVHEPIPVSPKTPSLMISVGAPVIIGPMNGGMEYPKAFHRKQSAFTRAFVTLGRWLSNFANRLAPGKLRAQVLLVANPRTRLALPAGVQGKVLELVENGVDLSLWTNSIQRECDGVVHFIFVGRLVEWKGVDLLFNAFQIAQKTHSMRLTIIGDGPARRELEEVCARLELTRLVTFKGWLSQRECARELNEADVFVLPSLFECGGAVVLEAMAASLPVIATNWGGPADYLDASCGILVDPSSAADFVESFARAMTTLARSPELRTRMGAAGRSKVVYEFDWQKKVDRMLTIYELAAGAASRFQGRMKNAAE